MSASARRVYILTFVTYALVHGTRTCWSYIKTYSQNEPLNFSTQFLGELDMTVLICLSISLKTLGWIG
jgi:succinate dehydrogenase hydrophobic anchor subunit